MTKLLAHCPVLTCTANIWAASAWRKAYSHLWWLGYFSMLWHLVRDRAGDCAQPWCLHYSGTKLKPFLGSLTIRAEQEKQSVWRQWIFLTFRQSTAYRKRLLAPPFLSNFSSGEIPSKRKQSPQNAQVERAPGTQCGKAERQVVSAFVPGACIRHST